MINIKTFWESFESHIKKYYGCVAVANIVIAFLSLSYFVDEPFIVVFIELIFAVVVSLFIKHCKVLSFIILLLTLVVFYRYFHAFDSFIKHNDFCGKDIVILVCIFIYPIVALLAICKLLQIFKENLFYFFLINIINVFFGILDSNNWQFFNILLAIIVFLLNFDNLNMICKKIFMISIKNTEENQQKLVMYRLFVLVGQILIYISIFLSKILCNYEECYKKNHINTDASAIVQCFLHHKNNVNVEYQSVVSVRLLVFFILCGISYVIYINFKNNIVALIKTYLLCETSVSVENAQ